MRRALRTAGRVLRETLLTLAALGGAVSIVLTVLAFTGGYSLIMFKTGSMAPTIPAGSVALVTEISASEVEVGDILTVDRAGALPVTHRVTSIEPGSTPAQRTITMRGDANETEDPVPYSIEHAREVIGSVPHLAHVIVWFGHPWVLGGLTLGASALVTWAFWPRSQKRVVDGEADGTQESAEPGVAGAARAGAVTTTAVLVAAACIVGTASPAEAAGAEDPLTLRSSLPADDTHVLRTTEPLEWFIDVDAAGAATGGELRVTLAGSGDATLGMQVEVRSCAHPWEGNECSRHERLLMPTAVAPLDGVKRQLFDAATPTAVYFRLSLTAQPTEVRGGGRAQLVVRASASGAVEEATLGAEPPLERTGASMSGMLLAPVAILTGLALAWCGSRRTRRRRVRA